MDETQLIEALRMVNGDHLRRILVVRNDRLGDLVLTLPALAAIRRDWPRAHVSVLASRYAAPLLAGSPLVDEVIEDDPQASAWQLSRRLRAGRYDAALVINTNTRNCLAVWASGIRSRVCWGYKAAGWLSGNRRVYLHRSHPPVHEAEFALAFVRRLGSQAKLAELAPQLVVEPQARQRVAQRIERELGTQGPLFGIHPGNGASAYNWPVENYALLASRLSDAGRVIITGSESERPLLALLRDRLTARARGEVLIVNDFSLPEMIAALDQLSVLTASSTGPLHIAGVLGTAVVGLFSPHPAHVPAKWSPLGTRQRLLVAPLAAGQEPRVPPEQAAELMARISVDEVVAANVSFVQRQQQSPHAA